MAVRVSPETGSATSAKSQRCCSCLKISEGCVILTVLIPLVLFAIPYFAMFFLYTEVCEGDRESPIVQIHNFSVSNLTTTTWEANLTITNPSNRHTLRLHNMKASVYYKNTDNNATSSCNYMTWNKHLTLKPHEVEIINVAATLYNDLVEEVRSKLRENNNSVTFVLEFAASGKVHCILTKKMDEMMDLKVDCGNLKVDFRDGSGSFVPPLDQPKNCSVLQNIY